MNAFDTAIARYHSTVRGANGTGWRGQQFIDKAHQTVLEAFDALSPAEQEKNRARIPPKVVCCDDGLFGISSGSLAFASAMHRGK
jgi:hypothetical protein